MECTNPGLFAAGPDWLEPGEQRRQETLWQVARGRAEGEGESLRLHVAECGACARLVESFRRLDRAALQGAPLFAACPGARELSDYFYHELPADRREKIGEHLKLCPVCREDLAWLERTAESKVVEMPRRRLAIFGVAAAVAALALFALLHRPGASRYVDLAQMPSIDRGDLVATLDQPDRFRPALEESLNAYDAGRFEEAESKVQPILQAFPSDPSALYVEAMAEYRQGHLNRASALMDTSERTQPMSAFRCWSALQMGLATGSRARIERECRHLEGHAQYRDRVQQIREVVRRRGA